jgi:LmbE family N-acetylglucosaminyl deacetylase
VTQAVHAAETEQGEAAETELQLGALQQRWQALAQRYPGQADLDLEIKDLVSQTDQRLGQLKSQYKRGAMEYDQVLSGLREQTSLLRNARFSNAEGQPVTINQEG